MKTLFVLMALAAPCFVSHASELTGKFSMKCRSDKDDLVSVYAYPRPEGEKGSYLEIYFGKETGNHSSVEYVIPEENLLFVWNSDRFVLHNNPAGAEITFLRFNRVSTDQFEGRMQVIRHFFNGEDFVGSASYAYTKLNCKSHDFKGPRID